MYVNKKIFEAWCEDYLAAERSAPPKKLLAVGMTWYPWDVRNWYGLTHVRPFEARQRWQYWLGPKEDHPDILCINYKIPFTRKPWNAHNQE